MIGRADIEGSKSNVAMNAWIPQASYPCGNFSDTSSFEFRRTKGSFGHAFMAPEGTVPSPSPGRHAATRSRRGSISSSPPTADGFGIGTPVPIPQSRSFSQTYGSILPTSLAYIVPSTRGCSPWRPNAVMSTTGCGRHSVLRIFKGRWERTGHHATCGALPAAGPYVRLSRFQDERFARQYRCGPPPEFPLASPRSGIVHHLSGPDRYAHTRTLLRRSRSVGGAPLGGIPPISFLAPYGFTRPLTRTNVRLLGPCFETGRMGSPQASVRSARMPEVRAAGHNRGDNIPRAYQEPGLWPPPNPRWSMPRVDRRTGLSPFHIRPGRIAGPHPLPSRQFKALFDSLFKVLFIFPSRYLFANGLSPVFSLGWNSPPDLGCISKQPDS
ncbi:hypothetical protein CQW23_33163 [Capsicum baccatum]|uniref:Protein TAR1 n=1 Tax=Capsicum baccatum TaxID=33114 RepID=A0A2G2V2N6_CAPBA|nr:hypothetical protein CQW23_33163 [Capsicum baccatum]